MVIILENQLFHLAYRIFPAVRHMLRNIRDFCPYDHARAVTQVIKILVMLVMRKPDGIGTHFTNQLHVFVMMLCRNRISDALPVLMPGHAAQRVWLPVQEKSLFRVHAECAHAKRDM